MLQPAPLFAVAVILLLLGCETISRDVTDSHETATSGWTKNAVYETVQPIFLIYDRFNNKYLIARSNADHVHASSYYQCWLFTLPRNLQQYQSKPSQWPEIVRVLPAGTKLRFDGAYNHGQLDWNLYDLDVRASIEDGSELSVNLACVSTPSLNGQQWERDSAWLR